MSVSQAVFHAVRVAAHGKPSRVGTRQVAPETTADTET